MAEMLPFLLGHLIEVPASFDSGMVSQAFSSSICRVEA
jgi:hypothetical protein